MAVYIIGARDCCGELQHAKIGYASDPAKRLATLQTGSPLSLEMIAVCWGGDIATERLLQSELRRRGSHPTSATEWFYAPDVCALLVSDAHPGLAWDIYLPVGELREEADCAEIVMA